MKQCLCIICGFIYDEALGMPEEGIPPGTAWSDIPDDWKCPECGVGKSDFEMIEVDAEVPVEAAPALSTPVPAADVGKVVIIGAGHAGFAAAEAIRKRHPAQPIVLLTGDAGDRYSKPKLSVCVSMTIPPASLVLEPAAAVASRLGIEVRSGVRVNRVDLEARVLETTIGPIPYGRLILATGADPIRLPWFDDTVLSINHLVDLARLASLLQQPRRVVIMGSGLIGCELANDLTRAGHRVTVLSAAPYPLDRLVPRAVGETLQTALSDVGVVWHMGVGVKCGRRVGDVSLIELEDGRVFESDVVISAIGLRPALQLAREAGLECGQGILVDHECRSSDRHVFALGDVAQYPDGVKQFIPPINHGAQLLAAALLDDADNAPQRHAAAASIPLMPIIAKTPDCPIAVLLPRGNGAEWRVAVEGGTTVARSFDEHGALAGLALAGPAANDLKPWLAQIRA